MQLLIPSFLRRLDHYLLIYCPLLWVSKIHYVLFYSMLALSLGGLFIYFYPLTSASYLPTYEETLFVGALLVIPVAIYWVYLQVIYKVNSKQFHFFAHAQFALHFLCFSIFTFLPFAFSAMGNEKIANLVTYEELIEDIDALNIGNHYFPTQNEGDTLWDDDRLITVKVKMLSEVSEYEKECLIRGKDTIEFTNSRYFSRFSFGNNPKLDLDNRLFSRTDDYKARCAIVKWRFLGSLKSEEYLKAWTFHSKKEEVKIHEINDYVKTYNKYASSPISASAKSILQQYLDKKVGKLITDNSKRELYDKMFSVFYATKTANFPTVSYFYVVIPFFIFSFSLLLFVFQRVQKFILALSIFIGIVYIITMIYVSGIISIFVKRFFYDVLMPFLGYHIFDGDYFNQAETVIYLSLFSSLFFFVFVLKVKKMKKHKHKVIVISILSSFFSLFSFLFIIFWIMRNCTGLYLEQHGSEYALNFELRDFYFILSFYSCLSLYFLIFVPFYHRLFTRLRSLPR